MILFFAIFLALLAVSSLLSVGQHQLPAVLLFPWFLWSLLGQSLSFPLTIVSGVIAYFAREDLVAMGAAGLASLCFLLAHLRNRAAGKTLLQAFDLKDKIPLFSGIWPFALGGRKNQRISNISYGPAGKAQMLDIIIAGDSDRDVPKPVLLHVHGGGWVMGRKREQAIPLMNYLAAKGWVCVDINYRMGPKNRMPAMIEDVHSAHAWIRENIAEYGGDPDRIAITGGSAGGHLTALAALTYDDPALGGQNGASPFFAAVPMYGLFDFLDRAGLSGKNANLLMERFAARFVFPGLPDEHRELWHAVSPIDRLREDAPPMLLIHGTGDTLLHAEGSQNFARELSQISSAPVHSITLKSIQHAFEIGGTALTWAHIRVVEHFLSQFSDGQKKSS